MIISRFAVAIGLLTFGTSAPTFAQYEGPPPGSYQQTCRQIEMRGPVLAAVCRDRRGEYIEAQIDVRECQGSVANRDGQLQCGR